MAGSSSPSSSQPVSSSAGGIYLLDSSVLVLSLRGDQAIKQRMDAAAQLYVSSTALGELFFGAYGASRPPADARAEVTHIAAMIAVLVADAVTADIYGRIKQEQRARGQMLPDNDLWIAATAIQYTITLAARDAHFTWIRGLGYEQW